MKKSGKHQENDGKCPYGFLFGVDCFQYDECENECPNNIFYKCKDIRQSCTGKADFGSMIIADQAAKKYSNQYREYNSYNCVHCGGWHIGSVWDKW